MTINQNQLNTDDRRLGDRDLIVYLNRADGSYHFGTYTYTDMNGNGNPNVEKSL
jgi:hypothetical protein